MIYSPLVLTKIISLTVENDLYAFLGVEFNTDKKSGKVTLTQGGLTKKVLKRVGMLDSNKKTTPAEKYHWESTLMDPPYMNLGSMLLLWECWCISPKTTGLTSSLKCTSVPGSPTIQGLFMLRK